MLYTVPVGLCYELVTVPKSEVGSPASIDVSAFTESAYP